MLTSNLGESPEVPAQGSLHAHKSRLLRCLLSIENYMYGWLVKKRYKIH